MKEITFNSNFGRFAYSITTTIGDDVNALTQNLCLRGLADTGFRAVASEVEKALVKAGHATKDTKRSEIEYSDEAAEIVATAAQAKLNAIRVEKDDDGKSVEVLPEMTFRVTGEHVYGEQEASRKMATAMWESIQNEEDEGKRAALLLSLGADEDTTTEAGIEKAHAFLSKFRAKRK